MKFLMMLVRSHDQIQKLRFIVSSQCPCPTSSGYAWSPALNGSVLVSVDDARKCQPHKHQCIYRKLCISKSRAEYALFFLQPKQELQKADSWLLGRRLISTLCRVPTPRTKKVARVVSGCTCSNRWRHDAFYRICHSVPAVITGVSSC